MSIKAGDIIADYEVVRALGAGGMGAVYEVRHLISNRREAIKILLPDLEGNQDLAERFLREIRLQASLSHPAIATMHTALRHNNQLLMVMEYVEGESLDKVLQRRGMGLGLAIEITTQLLDALDHAHSHGVVHRDVKPANIMVVAGNKVKLLDFGIARPFTDSRLTLTGVALGSLYYMSPEQIQGLAVDQRTDLYSAGITLYEMVTGTRPFTGDDTYSIMKAHIEQAPRPPDSLNPAVSPELSRTIVRALSKDPDQRFQNAREFARSLVAAEGTVARDAMTVRREPQEPPVRPPSSSGPALVMFEPEGIDRLTRQLATFIGPVAKLLVARAAKKAASWDELYRTLANEVSPGKDREKFLAARQR